MDGAIDQAYSGLEPQDEVVIKRVSWITALLLAITIYTGLVHPFVFGDRAPFLFAALSSPLLLAGLFFIRIARYRFKYQFALSPQGLTEIRPDGRITFISWEETTEFKENFIFQHLEFQAPAKVVRVPLRLKNIDRFLAELSAWIKMPADEHQDQSTPVILRPTLFIRLASRTAALTLSAAVAARLLGYIDAPLWPLFFFFLCALVLFPLYIRIENNTVKERWLLFPLHRVDLGTVNNISLLRRSKGLYSYMYGTYVHLEIDGRGSRELSAYLFQGGGPRLYWELGRRLKNIRKSSS